MRATGRGSRHRLAARSIGNAYDRGGQPRRHAEGRAGAHPANRVARYVDLRHQQIRTGRAEVHCKKEGSARNPIAAIIRHMPELSERRKALRFSALGFLPDPRPPPRCRAIKRTPRHQWFSRQKVTMPADFALPKTLGAAVAFAKSTIRCQRVASDQR